MLLGGSSPCQQCGCVSCNTCARTCTEPHTGAAFETVFTNYFEGVEVGNPTDGYLTATGDNDASDPYDGMDGTGPWMQEVGGVFSDGGSYGGGTRFPCTYRFSFWRSTRQLGINNPAPSTALTENVIELTVTAGAIVFPDGTVITPASGTVALASVPLVSGGAGAVDPRTNDGTVSFVLQCQNVETTFSVTARIRWNVQKRQHTLYGIVRECYEIGTPCATACSGSPPPNTIYLTIKNVSLSDGVTVDGFAGTYVLDRIPNFCETYGSVTAPQCIAVSGYEFDAVYATWTAITGSSPYGVSRTATKSGQSVCSRVNFAWFNSTPVPICGTGLIKSGSSGAVTVISFFFSATGTFDWEISA
jgi:hypothetical protein